MMILIADSGSTKTDWRLIDESGKISQAKTVGFNPYHQSSLENTLVLIVNACRPPCIACRIAMIEPPPLCLWARRV